MTNPVLNMQQIGDKGMVLVTWRDGGDEKLQAVVVERRPSDFWKRRSKKRKLQKKNAGSIGSTSSSTSVDGKSKLIGICCNDTELHGLKADEIDYYVHYIDHDR